MRPLIQAVRPFEGMDNAPDAQALKKILADQVLLVSEIKYTDQFKESLQKVLFGYTPVLNESLIMEVSIEILREAGLRLPKPIGPAMGIVGGLIIGQAAVEAGIVSPILVIVVSVTAISSFSVPMYSAGISIRLLRFVSMFFAASLGLYGVVMFFLLLSAHLIKLKSFGVPYLNLAVPIE